MMTAYAGDPVQVHVLAPWSEQAQVFSIEGHEWPQTPGLSGTPMRSSVTLGGLDALSLQLAGGAGGPRGIAGDYLYGDHREPYAQAGLWGLFRVRPDSDCGTVPLRPLSGSCSASEGGGVGQVALAGVVAALLVAVVMVGEGWIRRRRLHH
jgi:hypothetical protein